jgi:hypothetical protein
MEGGTVKRTWKVLVVAGALALTGSVAGVAAATDTSVGRDGVVRNEGTIDRDDFTQVDNDGTYRDAVIDEVRE